MENWIDQYLDYTKEVESPRSFHFWTAVISVSAALERKVWLDPGFSTIHPNFFVIFIAPPGRCRKTAAIRIGEDIVNQIPTINTIPDSTTKAALINRLSQVHKQYCVTDDGGQFSTVSHTSVTLFSTELTVFLGYKDFELLGNLNDLYDCKEKFEHTTIKRGGDFIPKVFFNILGATTPELLALSVPVTAVGGGFFSRTVCIVENKRRHRASRPTLDPQKRSDLIKRLEEIHKFEGEFKVDDDAWGFYDRWYNQLPEESNDFEARKHVLVLKLATVLAAGEHRQRILERDLKKAIEEISIVEHMTSEAFSGIGRNPQGYAISKLLSELREKGKVYEREFLEKHWQNIGVDEIRNACEVLIRIGQAKIKEDRNGERFLSTV